MGWTSVRWVFLLALSLTILGAIQCPHTPGSPPSSPKRSGSPMKTIVRKISHRLSKMRSGSSSRSDSGSDNDGGGGSGSDNEDMPASGNYSGGGRYSRSRSPSPSRSGGGGGRRGGAGSSGGASSSGGSTINKMYGAYQSENIPNICLEINNRGAAQVVRNMQLSVFTNIIRELRMAAATDECKKNVGRGYQPGSQKCQEMYGEFKKIEPQYRGECADAVSAQCFRWPANSGAPEEKKCTFFIQTGYRSTTRLDGFYASMEDCIEGIKHQLFTDDQLAGLGIHPPENPPKPLLPPGYSPDH